MKERRSSKMARGTGTRLHGPQICHKICKYHVRRSSTTQNFNAPKSSSRDTRKSPPYQTRKARSLGSLAPPWLSRTAHTPRLLHRCPHPRVGAAQGLPTGGLGAGRHAANRRRDQRESSSGGGWGPASVGRGPPSVLRSAKLIAGHTPMPREPETGSKSERPASSPRHSI